MDGGDVGETVPLARPLLIPALLLLVTAGTIFSGVLTPRDLSLGEDMPIWNTNPDLWVFNLTRAVTALVILASVVIAARVTIARGFPRAGLPLWLAYLGFILSNFVLPGLAGREPGFDRRLLLPPFAFTALYFARPVPTERLVALAKAVLCAFVYASLAAAVVLPAQALATYVEGIIPALPIRLYGVGGGATSLGFLSSTYLALELVVPSRSRWRLVHLAAATAALVLTQAKTSWIFVLLVVAFLMVRRLRRVRFLRMGDGPSARMIRAVLLVCGAAGLLALGIAQARRVDLRSLQGGENLVQLTGRTYIWATSARAWLDDPIFGYGLGLWESERFRFEHGPFDHAHNQFLHALASAGLIGLVGLLVYLGAAFAAARRSARTTAAPLVLLVAVVFLCSTNTPLRAYYMLDAFALFHMLLFALLVNTDKLEAAAGQG